MIVDSTVPGFCAIEKSMAQMAADIEEMAVDVDPSRSAIIMQCVRKQLAKTVTASYLGTVSPGIEPGYIVFPSHKNNVQLLLGVLLPCEKENKFLAVRRVSA
jgi:hypothetical protein